MNNKTVHATKWKQKRNNKIVHAEKICFSQIPPCDQMLVGLTVNNVVCNTTLKEVNKSFNCPYLIGIFDFFLYSNKIRPIITAQNHNFSSPSYNCCRACINESVSMLHVRSMYFTATHTCKECTIFSEILFTFSYQESTGHIYTIVVVQ